MSDNHAFSDTTPAQRESTATALIVLNDLVYSARVTASNAPDEFLKYRGEDIAHTLDGVRTTLVQEGIDYLDSAWAFIDAGRKMIAQLKRIISKANR